MAVDERASGFAEQNRNRPRRQSNQDRLSEFVLPEYAGAATKTGDPCDAQRLPLAVERHAETPAELKPHGWKGSGQDNVRTRRRLERERDAFDEAVEIGANAEGSNHKAILAPCNES